MSRRFAVSFAVAAALLVVSPLARAQMMGGGMGGMGGPQGGPPAEPSEDVLPEVDEEIGKDAEKVFARAEQEYADEDWLEAIAYYQHLRTKFSYNVKLAALAELRLGDVAFEREKFAEARSFYRSFLRFHPKHEKAAYAGFRVGLSSYRDIPTDSWITPASKERDQSDVREALRQMREFRRSFPNSEFQAQADELVAKCEDKLASHELYVAEFYASREKWAGTVLRARTLVNTYPESTLAPEALALQVEAHSKLGEKELAEQAFAQLQARKPDPELIARCKSALGQ